MLQGLLLLLLLLLLLDLRWRQLLLGLLLRLVGWRRGRIRRLARVGASLVWRVNRRGRDRWGLRLCETVRLRRVLRVGISAQELQVTAR
jgi:hypothetical protein